MERIPPFVWQLVTLSLITLHIFLAPYTKVEESFNLQASHDLLSYGPQNVAKYDHLEFPGVVPRTFLGPLALWLPTSLAKHYIVPTFVPHATKFAYQYIVRWVLGFAVALSLNAIRKSVTTVFGPEAAAWASLFTIVQFHLLFWASRTLPNIFALVLVNFAVSRWINDGLPVLSASKKSHGPI